LKSLSVRPEARSQVIRIDQIANGGVVPEMVRSAQLGVLARCGPLSAATSMFKYGGQEMWADANHALASCQCVVSRINVVPWTQLRISSVQRLLRFLLPFAAMLACPTSAFAASCSATDVQKAASEALNNVPPAYLNPPMMAIGDSLFNGMTSLTIDANRARLSTPALVARSLGLTSGFREVEYPRPVLANFEDELKHTPGWLLSHLGKDLQENIRSWQNDYPSGAPAGTHSGLSVFYDNIAVAGATSDQLLCDTAGANNVKWRSRAITLWPLGIPALAGDWHQEINTSFILNPQDFAGQPDTTGHPSADFSGLSQMAEVVLRKPGRLLINIGSNDGLWRAAFGGTPIPEQDILGLIENVRMIVRLIPVETKFVYVNNLIPPSRAPNLKPVSRSREQRCNSNDQVPEHNGKLYFGSYRTYLNFGALKLVDGATACSFDTTADRINNQVKAAMLSELASRVAAGDAAARDIQLTFIDFNQLLWDYDRKHYRAGRTLDFNFGRRSLHLNNDVVRPSLLIPPLARTGGVSGYDNMHPSMPMYGLGAEKILAAILDPRGPEMTNPIVSQRPHAVAQPDALPQCVSDELNSGTAPAGLCPDGLDGQAFDTSVNMTQVAWYNLFLVHQAESFLGARNVFLARGSRNRGTSSLQDTGAACAIAESFDIIAHGSRDPATQHSLAPTLNDCSATESRLQAFR